MADQIPYDAEVRDLSSWLDEYGQKKYTDMAVSNAVADDWLRSQGMDVDLSRYSDTYDSNGQVHLDDLYDAVQAGKSSGSGGSGGSSSGGSAAGLRDSGLNLDRYTGNTRVELSENERNIMDLVNQLVTGQYGNYKQLLSGKPDFGQLYAGVIEPARRELQENALPQIADIYGASPHGAGYNSGARKEAQAGALRGFADNVAGLRYQATEQAKQTGLQAAGMLPSFENIQMIERLNEIANIERDIGVHYRNQGLSVEEFNADMAFTNSMLSAEQSEAMLGLEQEKIDLQREMFDAQLQQQRDAQKQSERSGIFGSVGSLLGAGIGLATGTGPLGMMMGSSLGGGLGLISGGAPGAGYQTVAGGIGQYGQSMYNQQMLSNIMGQMGQQNTTGSAMMSPLYSGGMTPAYLRPTGNYFQDLYNQGTW